MNVEIWGEREIGRGAGRKMVQVDQGRVLALR